MVREGGRSTAEPGEGDVGAEVSMVHFRPLASHVMIAVVWPALAVILAIGQRRNPPVAIAGGLTFLLLTVLAVRVYPWSMTFRAEGVRLRYLPLRLLPATFAREEVLVRLSPRPYLFRKEQQVALVLRPRGRARFLTPRHVYVSGGPLQGFWRPTARLPETLEAWGYEIESKPRSAH